MNATTEPSRSYVRLAPGDPAPWFNQRSTSNPNYAFDTAAGRYIVLCFFASAGDPIGRAAMQSVLAHRQQFDDVRLSFFGVSLDPGDETEGRVHESLPGIRFFWDSNGTVSRLYGALPKAAERGKTPVAARRPVCVGRQRCSHSLRLSGSTASAGAVRRRRGAGANPLLAGRIRARVLPPPRRRLPGAW